MGFSKLKERDSVNLGATEITQSSVPPAMKEELHVCASLLVSLDEFD